MDIKLVMLALSAGVMLFGIFLLVLSIAMRHQVAVADRVKMLAGTEERAVKTETFEDKQKKKKTKLPVSKMFEEQLSMAGISMRGEEFLIIWIGLIIVPALFMILLDANIISTIAIVAFAVVLPPVFVRSRRRKQLILFDNQLGDALLLIGNCLRSGLTFQQAMGSIAKEMQDPIAKEFSRVVKEVQLGTGLDDALENMLRRIGSQELMLTISAVQIQHQIGGNLMEILQNISSTIMDRQKLKSDIRVMTASGRTSGLVIGALPLIVGGLLMLINPGYIEMFFSTDIGTAMLIGAGVMEVLGFLVIRKVIDIKY